jgi:hypothetical protein
MPPATTTATPAARPAHAHSDGRFEPFTASATSQSVVGSSTVPTIGGATADRFWTGQRREIRLDVIVIVL